MAAHGSSPAAWTGVVIALAGFVLGAIALVIGPNWVMFAIAAALLPLAAIVAKIMSAAGLGEPSRR